MNWIRQSFWVADLCLLAMLAFFIVLGGVNLGQATGVAIAVAAMALLASAHAWALRRHHADLERSPESRYARERRGF